VILPIAVLLAAVLHAVWNALAHVIPSKSLATALLSAGFMTGGLVALPFTGAPDPASWGFLATSALVHAVYLTSLVRSYRLGAFNQVYPLARGMSPWLVALVATLVVGEHLNALQLCGVLVVSIGLFCLVFARGRPHVEETPAILAAVATGVLIATYTVLDGLGVRRSGDPLAYAAWLFFLQGALVLGYGVARRGRALVGAMGTHWRLGVGAALSAVTGYALVLWAQAHGSLAMVAALRETSVIVGAVIGALVFREPFGPWRTVSTVIVVSGIALINLA